MSLTTSVECGWRLCWRAGLLSLGLAAQAAELPKPAELSKPAELAQRTEAPNDAEFWLLYDELADEQGHIPEPDDIPPPNDVPQPQHTEQPNPALEDL
ncbi:MAG: hypothetical protein RL497_278 [Pseudomonadota bacterium]|jgi:hypothetical protein